MPNPVQPEVPSVSPPEAPTIFDLLVRHEVDLAHAEAVRRLAVDIFRATAAIHGLEEAHWLPLLEAGALLHNVGLKTHPKRHHRVGRDIVLEHGLQGYDWQRTAVVAALVSFHRKRVRPRTNSLLHAMRKEYRRPTLRLAAILRVADGLDTSRDQSVRVAGAVETSRGVVLGVTAASVGIAMLNITRAVEKADLWNRTMPAPLLLQEGTELPSPGAYLSLNKTLRANVARIVSHHAARLFSHEAGVLADRDIEEVHRMRVATRRLRAALRSFRTAYRDQEVDHARMELSWFADELGRVRDDDTLLEALAEYQAQAPKSHLPVLRKLETAIRAERMQHLASLTEAIGSPRYGALKRELAALTDPESDVPKRGRRLLSERAPELIARGWDRLLGFSAPLALDPPPELLHEARITAKRQRYLLEFLRPVYPGLLDADIERLVRMQDALGIVNDVHVHLARLEPHVGTAAAAQKAFEKLRETWLLRSAERRAEFEKVWAELTTEFAAQERNVLLDRLRPLA